MPETPATPPQKPEKTQSNDYSGLGVALGTSLLGPVVAKGIGSLFGLDEASEEERRAAAQREDAIRRLKEQAEGRTASPAELMARQQQQRTIQALSSLAARGTAQQQAGAQRAAMQAAPEVMAQQGANAAAARAAEMERGRNALAQAQMIAAQQEAAQGRADREYMQRLIGAGVQGAAGIAGLMALQGPKDEKKKPTPPGTPEQPGSSGSELGSSSQGLAAAATAAGKEAVANLQNRSQDSFIAATAPVNQQKISVQPASSVHDLAFPAPALPTIGTPSAGPSLGPASLQMSPPSATMGNKHLTPMLGQPMADGQTATSGIIRSLTQQNANRAMGTSGLPRASRAEDPYKMYYPTMRGY